MPLDAPRDPVEADLLAFPIVARRTRLGRSRRQDLLLDAVEDRVARRSGKFFPRRVERETQRLRGAVHHPTVPRVRVVLKSFTHKTTASNAPLRIGDAQFRVRELVHSEAAA